MHVYVLVTEDTLEDSLLTTLGAKKELALAAIDPDSEVDAVDLASGVEELKRRLEVLLGARPEAPLDQSEQARVTTDAARTAQRDRMAAAAGQMLSAALSFLGELLPAPAVDGGARLEAMAAELERGLRDCTRRDEQGRLSLTLTLPEGSGANGSANGADLAGLALSLARIAAAQGSPSSLSS